MSIEYKVVQKRNPVDPSAPKKFYALAVHKRTFNLKQLARELAARSTTASEGDVHAVLIGLRDLMKEHLERSDRVVLDGIGSFAVALTSEGAESEDKFHSSLIKVARMLFKSDSEMKGFLGNLRYMKESK